jgi:DNA polymerase-3 subunit beta
LGHCSARQSCRTRNSAACGSCSGTNQLKIICTNSEQEEAEEELEIAYSGEALDVGFNINYLLDVLQNLAMDRVEVAFGDANSSALVTVPERDDYKYVVMPMRI